MTTKFEGGFSVTVAGTTYNISNKSPSSVGVTSMSCGRVGMGRGVEGTSVHVQLERLYIQSFRAKEHHKTSSRKKHNIAPHTQVFLQSVRPLDFKKLSLALQLAASSPSLSVSRAQTLKRENISLWNKFSLPACSFSGKPHSRVFLLLLF